MKEASETYLKGVSCVHPHGVPIVSSDIIHDPHSSIFRLAADHGHGRRRAFFAKVIAWYDNERGYSCRVKDLVKESSCEHLRPEADCIALRYGVPERSAMPGLGLFLHSAECRMGKPPSSRMAAFM